MNDISVQRSFVLNENDELNDPDVITYSDYGGAMDYVQFQDDAGVIATFDAGDIESIIDILHEILEIRNPARGKPKNYAYR